MTKEKKKALDLVNHYQKIVYPYIGSAFMTGDESEELKFKSGKKEADFVCDMMLDLKIPYSEDYILKNFYYENKLFWIKVKEEIQKIHINEIFFSKAE